MSNTSTEGIARAKKPAQNTSSGVGRSHQSVRSLSPSNPTEAAPKKTINEPLRFTLHKIFNLS
eukprot:698020-Amphidinium_carterae.1